MKTIAIPEDLHKELMDLKLDERSRNMAKTIKKLVEEHKQRGFLEASDLFRKKLKESGKSFSEFLKEARKIREEIADEWYPN